MNSSVGQKKLPKLNDKEKKKENRTEGLRTLRKYELV